MMTLAIVHYGEMAFKPTMQQVTRIQKDCTGMAFNTPALGIDTVVMCNNNNH